MIFPDPRDGLILAADPELYSSGSRWWQYFYCVPVVDVGATSVGLRLRRDHIHTLFRPDDEWHLDRTFYQRCTPTEWAPRGGGNPRSRIYIRPQRWRLAEEVFDFREAILLDRFIPFVRAQ